jgi:hypothetical protein
LALAGKFNAKYRPDWYGYAGGNPLRRIDRKGLNEQDYQDCVFNCELIGGACIVAAGVGCAITGPDYPVCAIGGVCLCVAMEQACEKDCEKKRWQ